VIVVGARGMGVGCCRLSLTVVFVVVGGVVNLNVPHMLISKFIYIYFEMSMCGTFLALVSSSA
jgi:hypothetical protein